MWKVVDLANVPPTPWKNGGGVTRQLLAWPEGATEWTLRVSIADVTNDGPFSIFEGIRRWFAILEGDGVRLFDSMEIVVGAPLYEFDGALAPSCTLLGGCVRDFNIMLKEDTGMKLQVIDIYAEPNLKACNNARLYAIFTVGGGTLHIGSSEQVALPPMSLTWNDSLNINEEICTQVNGPGIAYWLLLQ